MAVKKLLPEAASAVLDRISASSRFPHCILLTGGSDNARRYAATHIAAMIECTSSPKPCGKCRDCGKVLGGVHPDVSVIESSGKSATVRLDDLRIIKETAERLPNEGIARVYIIPQAGRIRPEGQNALLKLIEEPPTHVYMILAAEVRATLLPTVLSRLYEINLGAEAAQTLSSKTEKKLEDVCTRAVAALTAKDEFALAASIAQLAKDRNNITRCAEKLRLVLRDAMTGAEGLSGMPDAAATLAGTYSVPRLLQMRAALETVIQAAARNGNANLLLYLFSSGMFAE